MGNRYVKLDDNEKILYVDANKLFGCAISESLPYDEIERWHGHPDLYLNKLVEIINTSDDSDFDYFLEVDLRYPANLKAKTEKFPFRPENKVIPKDKYNDYIKKIKRKFYRKAKKLM